MDPLVKSYNGFEDKDLFITPFVAYQRDMSQVIEYDEAYFEKCASYDKEICKKVNDGRVSFVNKHFKGEVLDVGIGAGDFVSSRPNTFGYDVNPKAVEWLKGKSLYSDDFESFDAFTFWDVLEHVENPQEYLERINPGAYVFVSLPVFDLTEIRESKHYRPGEHLYYWTTAGFIVWMKDYGFQLVDLSDHEINSGREDIKAFAFKRG